MDRNCSNKRQHAADTAAVESEDENESNSCQICFSKWTSHGEHQLCSLRCGHFFGLSCIHRTLRDQGRTSRHCPMCNQPAKESDIRLHFAVTSITAKDVSKEVDLKAQLSQERAARVQAELILGKAKVQIETLQSEVAKLKDQLLNGVPTRTATSPSTMLPAGGGFVPSTAGLSLGTQMTLPVLMNKSRACCWISSERGAVVATYLENSKKYKVTSVHPDFPNRSSAPSGGGGHELPIRDIALQSSNSVCYGGTLATGSLDGMVKLISVSNLNEVCEFALAEPVWSVCFLRDNVLLAGSVKGKVLSLDPRMPKGPVMAVQVGNEPIHSIFGMPMQPDTACVGSFTRVSVVSPQLTVDELSGLPPRSIGDQYSSLAHGSDGTIALSIRSQTESFVEIGQVTRNDNGTAVFTSMSRYKGFHGRPSGRMAYYDQTAVLVPDETSKSCIFYPGGSQVGAGNAAYAGAWFCGSPNLAMLLGNDKVRFIQLE